MHSQRILLTIFVAVAALHLVPVWAPRTIPTADGPAHLYNAWILHGIVTRTAHEPITTYFAIDWRPHPNWSGHAIMALLLFVVPPIVAEKLLFTIIVAAFFTGAWMLAGADDERGHAYAFLAVPFTFNQLLQTGFYNFSLSFALWMIVVAYWWRHRDRASVKTISTTALLLVLCYFSHPMSTALAIGSIGVMWLYTARRRASHTNALHLVALAPASLLLLWFIVQHAGGVVSDRRSIASLLKYIVRNEVIFNFGEWQFYAGLVLSLILIALSIATALREPRRDADVFVVLFVIFLALFLWSPDAFAGGSLLTERLSLFVPLVLLPWLSPQINARAIDAIVGFLALFAIFNAGFYTVRFRQNAAVVRQMVKAFAPVAPDSTLLPLLLDRTSSGSFVGYVSHVPAYAAIEKRLVDFDNYEASTGYFPIRWSPDVVAPEVYALEANPESIDVAAWPRRARFVMTWKMSPVSGLAVRLERQYRLAGELGNARIYESKSSFAKFSDPDMILLPLAGSERWQIEQRVRNDGATPVRIALNSCPTPPCDFDIAPHQSIATASGDDTQPYILIRGERKQLAHLQSETTFRGIAIPQVRAADFAREPLVFKNVPLMKRERLNLRVWALGTRGRVAYSVRIVQNGSELARRMFATDPNGFVTDFNLGGQFPQIEGTCDVVVAIENTPDPRAWGFLIATERATNSVQMIYPTR